MNTVSSMMFTTSAPYIAIVALQVIIHIIMLVDIARLIFRMI